MKGGLGNQLFQYAFGYTLAKRYDDELKLDIEWFETEGKVPWLTPRKYELDKFVIPSSSIISHRNLPLRIRILGHRFIRKPFEFIHISRFYLGKWAVVGSDSKYDYLKLRQRPNIFLNGYYDNYAAVYLKESIDDLRKEFVPRMISEKTQALIEEVTSINSTAIHVRRSDQLHSKGHIAGIDYYKKAIEEMSRRAPGTFFYVFSDDIEWCKEQFTEFDRIKFVDDSDESDATSDFICMIHCTNNIIAYSTYSWWAAMLNPYKNKIVITPFFYDSRGFLPEDWIQLKIGSTGEKNDENCRCGK